MTYPPTPSKSVQSLRRRDFRCGLEMQRKPDFDLAGKWEPVFEAKICQVGVVDLQ